MYQDEKVEKLVALARLLPESEKEKLNCVVQGMLLAQNSKTSVEKRDAEKQAAC